MNKIIEEDIQGIIASPIIDWERFRNKSVLITGANGMLPSYMVFTLLLLNKNNNMNINIYALARNEGKLQRVFNPNRSLEKLSNFLLEKSSTNGTNVSSENRFHQ